MARRMLALAVVLFLPALLPMGCKRTGVSHRKLIAIIVPSQDNPFFQAEAVAAAERAKALGYDVRIDSHNDDPYSQDNLIDVAIASNASALILDNAGAEASISAVRRATKAGIACFLIDREIGASNIAKAQIIADNAGGAVLLGKRFAEIMGGKGKYAELLGRESDTNAQIRTTGFHAVLDKFPALVRVSAQSANWSQSEAFQRTETILQAHGDLNGIIAGNDTMAVGAVAAVRNARMDTIKVVGFDGSPDALSAIRAGALDATILQPAVKIAGMAVEEADQFLKTGSTGVPERQLVPCELVTRQNVDEFGTFQRIKPEKARE
ncbi:MAG TPA: D-ribose ABC transporter substrate-binding protein [Terracidiphilus sp.]|nr:D-ribose ABC transporter substrate-binding protein [Terracidiphilus sp.]